MSNRLLVSTKKGLFTVDRGLAGWRVSRVSFLAENVTLAHADPRDGGWFAALNLGHFDWSGRGSLSIVADFR